ncbi:MAG: hypothetical protein M3320_06015 [Actinomycetota bacterium]|nr:hypothetical protein [Actinomycetota bacterium]MDQ5808214.1 hypothetical protein [Actinomycetota bacterium]
MRSSISLPCPGSLATATVVVHTPEQSQWGLGNPANVGSCPLSITGVDAAGNRIDPMSTFVLQPGESAQWYYPPAGTARIIAACFENCTGETVLEFDTPIA